MRARGQDDMVRFEDLFPAFQFLDLHLLAGQQFADTLDDGDFVLLEEIFHALVHRGGNPAAAGADGRQVRFDLAGRETVVSTPLGVVQGLSALEQRLGRNTAPVEADSAELTAFDNRCIESELRRPDCGHVPSRARADDDNIVFHTYASLP